jgi:hypothetical protein
MPAAAFQLTAFFWVSATASALAFARLTSRTVSLSSGVSLVSGVFASVARI